MRARLNLQRLSRAAIVVAVACLATPAAALAADPWNQFQGGATHPGVAADAPAPPYRVAWKLAIAPGGPDRNFGVSAPVFDGTTVITVAADSVVAADATSGQQLWTIRRAIGPSVSPAVDQADRLVLFTEGWGPDGPRRSASASESPSSSQTASPSPSTSPSGTSEPAFAGPSRLVAYSLDGDHAKAWSLDLPQVSRSGITIDGTTAYVGTNDGTLTAVDASTGHVRWSADVGGPIETPVAAGTGVVIASVTGTDVNAPARLVAVRDTDGSPAWTYTPDRPFALGGPVTLVDDTAYVVFPNDQLVAVAADTGALRWSARMTNPSIFPISATADAIYVADAFGEVYRLDPSTGARVWTFALNEPFLRAGPLVIGAHVVLVTLRGDVVALDAATGDLVFRGDASDHPLRDVGANGDALVVVGSRADTGLIGLTSDPAGSLVRERSPTIFDPSRFALGFAAVIPMLAVLLFAGRAWWNRLGPIELGAPEDAWEADVDGGGTGDEQEP